MAPLHEPVLVSETVALLEPARGGLFVDCTVGLGGHSRVLLEAGASRILGFDRDPDALALADLVGDTAVRLDLIEVTDHTGRFKPPGREEFRQFRDKLAQRLKQPVVRRYSGGADIEAACGTLAGLG